jgi:hypothetical protein
MRIRLPTPAALARTLLSAVQRAAPELELPALPKAGPDAFEVRLVRRVGAAELASAGTPRVVQRQFLNAARYGLVSRRELRALEAELSAHGVTDALDAKLNGLVSATLANPTLRLSNLTERLDAAHTASERRSARRELVVLQRQLDPKSHQPPSPEAP